MEKIRIIRQPWSCLDHPSSPSFITILKMNVVLDHRDTYHSWCLKRSNLTLVASLVPSMDRFRPGAQTNTHLLLNVYFFTMSLPLPITPDIYILL